MPAAQVLSPGRLETVAWRTTEDQREARDVALETLCMHPRRAYSALPLPLQLPMKRLELQLATGPPEGPSGIPQCGPKCCEHSCAAEILPPPFSSLSSC